MYQAIIQTILYKMVQLRLPRFSINTRMPESYEQGPVYTT